MCFEIYQLDSAKFLSAHGLVWQVALKKTEVKFEIEEEYFTPLTDM